MIEADALARELAERASAAIVFGLKRGSVTDIIVRETKLRELCAVAEALRLMVAEGECYCADNVAAKGVCGHCQSREALAALDGGGK